MFLRMTAVVLALQPSLLRSMGVPMIVGALVLLALSFIRRPSRSQVDAAPSPVEAGNPFDLSTALGFGLMLGALALLTRAAQHWMGDVGLYALSLLSGLLDVDAILLTVMHMNREGALHADQAMVAAGLAVLANMAMKAGLSWLAGDRPLGRQVILGFMLAMVAVAGTALLVSSS